MKTTKENVIKNNEKPTCNCGNPKCTCVNCTCGDSCPGEGCTCGCNASN